MRSRSWDRGNITSMCLARAINTKVHSFMDNSIWVTVTTQQIKFVVFNPIFSYSFGIALSDWRNITERDGTKPNDGFVLCLPRSLVSHKWMLHSNWRGNFVAVVAVVFSCSFSFWLHFRWLSHWDRFFQRTTFVHLSYFAFNLIFCSFGALSFLWIAFCLINRPRSQTQQAPKIPAAFSGDFSKASMS